MPCLEFVKVGTLESEERSAGYSRYHEIVMKLTHDLSELPPGTEIAVRVPKGCEVPELRTIVFK